MAESRMEIARAKGLASLGRAQQQSGRKDRLPPRSALTAIAWEFGIPPPWRRVAWLGLATAPARPDAPPSLSPETARYAAQVAERAVTRLAAGHKTELSASVDGRKRWIQTLLISAATIAEKLQRSSTNHWSSWEERRSNNIRTALVSSKKS